MIADPRHRARRRETSRAGRCSSTRCSDHGRNQLAQRLLVGALERVDDVAASEEEEGGHRRDAQLAREAGQLVDVDLDEDGRLGVLVRERLERRRDALARTAPRRREVCAPVGIGMGAGC